MRIVHEINGNAQVGAGAKPYTKSRGQKKPRGYVQADVLICAKDPLGGPDEEIHIEGNSKYIKRALQDAVDLLTMAEEMHATPAKKRRR